LKTCGDWAQQSSAQDSNKRLRLWTASLYAATDGFPGLGGDIASGHSTGSRDLVRVANRCYILRIGFTGRTTGIRGRIHEYAI
jgi:hypothetical protein